MVYLEEAVQVNKPQYMDVYRLDTWMTKDGHSCFLVLCTSSSSYEPLSSDIIPLLVQLGEPSTTELNPSPLLDPTEPQATRQHHFLRDQCLSNVDARQTL